MFKQIALIAATLGTVAPAFADETPVETHASMDVNFAQVNESIVEDGQTLVISVPFLADTCNTASLIGGWDIDHETKTVKYTGQIAQTLKACGGPVKHFWIFLEAETDEIFLAEDGVWTVEVSKQFEEDLFRRPWVNDFKFGWIKSNTIFQMLFN